MPERITSYDYNVRESETGVVITTVKHQETAELYHSVEDAIGRKDTEVWVKRGVGGALMLLGTAGTTSFGVAAFHENEKQVAFSALGIGLSSLSAGVAYAGYKFIESADNARDQWRQLKEFATQPQMPRRRYKKWASR